LDLETRDDESEIYGIPHEQKQRMMFLLFMFCWVYPLYIKKSYHGIDGKTLVDTYIKPVNEKLQLLSEGELNWISLAIDKDYTLPFKKEDLGILEQIFHDAMLMEYSQYDTEFKEDQMYTYLAKIDIYNSRTRNRAKKNSLVLWLYYFQIEVNKKTDDLILYPPEKIKDLEGEIPHFGAFR
jgi:hypothetical protein